MAGKPRPSRLAKWNARDLLIQTALVAAVLGVVVTIGMTTVANLEARGIAIDLDFLQDRAGFAIPESVIAYTPDDSNLRAIAVGIANTLYVTVIAALLSTLAGAAVGVMRISPEPVLASIARLWVDVTRNVPPILLLIFLYSLLGKLLPADHAASPFLGILASQRGIAFPLPDLPPMVALLAAAWTIVAIASPLVGFGARFPRARWAPASVTALLIGALWVGGTFSMDWPSADGADLRGGLILSPEFVSLIAGLVIYTSGFIAEIVRSGLESVPRGQWEAAASLGLSRRVTLSQVIAPQMIRVVLPALTSQYINTLKNSTLVIAVGFTDFLVVMGTMINRTSHAVEGTAIIVGVYLAISLSFSAAMAAADRRLRVRGAR